MQNIIFLLVALVHLAIFIYGFRNISKKSWYAILVFIVVGGLVYDNIVIGLGATIGEGDLLKTLNMPRFWIHALFTPAMMIACFGALRMMGVKFAQSKTWHIIICILTTAMIALGSYIDVLNLSLAANPDGDILKYSNTFEFMKGPPIPAVLTILVVLIFGISAWRNNGFKPLFIGSLLMFITAGMMSMPLAQNIGEVAFAVGLMLTQVRVAKN
jgi:hypothetical protein